MDASSSLCPPDRNVIPATAGSTVLQSAMATSLRNFWIQAWQGDHVGLQECASQIDMVVTQNLVENSQDLFSYILTVLQVMVPIRGHLTLHNRDNVILLTDPGIMGKNVAFSIIARTEGVVSEFLVHNTTWQSQAHPFYLGMCLDSHRALGWRSCHWFLVGSSYPYLP